MRFSPFMFVICLIAGSFAWAGNAKFFPCRASEIGQSQTRQVRDLLKSEPGKNPQIVGYFELFKNNQVVGYMTILDINSKLTQLGDLYLCTDYSHDYYYLTDESDKLSTWKAGGRIDGVEQDEAVAVIYARPLTSSTILVDFFARSLAGEGILKDRAALSLKVKTK